MCIAAAIAGSAVVGGVAANSAAKKQAKAANKAADLQQKQYEQTREDQSPFLGYGVGALNRLNTLLGIAPEVKPFTPQFDEAAYLRQNPDVAAQVAQGKLSSGLEHYNKYGVKERRAMPMTQAPVAAQPADFGRYARDFSMKDFQASPDYKFRLDEGFRQQERAAAARTGLMSGGALKAAQRFGQQMASEEFDKAFNRYQVNRANQLTPLQSMAGQGQTTAAQLGMAGQNYATQAGNAYGAAAQAQASGYMGGANALSQGVGQYMNYTSNNDLINSLERNRAAAPAPAYSPPSIDRSGDNLDPYARFAPSYNT